MSAKFDVYSTEEEALKSFGCNMELRGLSESPRALATKIDGPSMQVRQVESVTILDVGGKLRGETSRILRDQIKELLDAGKTKILLNLSGITFMDSGGLSCLIATHLAAREAGVPIKYLLSRPVIKVIKIAKIL